LEATDSKDKDLRETLKGILSGKVGFLGIGNTDRADDGAGIALARMLGDRGVENIFEGGATPERLIPKLRDGGFATIVFIDAVEAGLETGAAILLDARQMQSAFPQVSTHKLALSTLAGLIAEDSGVRVWLIGVQAKTIEMDTHILSPEVDSTIRALADIIAEAMMRPAEALQERLCN
jgi:hydrogenase maturation protease